MSAIDDLREWQTPQEAAARLTRKLKDAPVTEADLYRLALEGRLTLSVEFRFPIQVRRGHRVTDVEALNSPDGNAVLNLQDGTRVAMEDSVTTIKGVWDLPMLGGERFAAERRFAELTEGPPVYAPSGGDGAFVADQTTGLYQLGYVLGSSGWSAYGTLPDDSTLVVRTSTLLEFEKRIFKDPDRPLGTKERTTLLALLYATAKEAGTDLRDRSVANWIQGVATKHEVQVSRRTIDGILKQIRDAFG